MNMNNKAKIVLTVFLGIAGFFLITEHTAHLYGFLPFGLLLICLLMHVFMHGGHGKHEEEKKGGHHHG